MMLGKDISKNTFEYATTPYLVLHSVKEVARCCSTQDNRPYHGARHSPEKIFNLLIKSNLSPEDTAKGAGHAAPSIRSGI